MEENFKTISDRMTVLSVLGIVLVVLGFALSFLSEKIGAAIAKRKGCELGAFRVQVQLLGLGLAVIGFVLAMIA